MQYSLPKFTNVFIYKSICVYNNESMCVAFKIRWHMNKLPAFNSNEYIDYFYLKTIFILFNFFFFLFN